MGTGREHDVGGGRRWAGFGAHGAEDGYTAKRRQDQPKDGHSGQGLYAGSSLVLFQRQAYSTTK